MRQVTETTLKVVYGVRLSFTGGEPALQALDDKVKRLLEAAFPDDPLLKITRGDAKAMRDNPYPSAGFLHDGGVHVPDLPGPVTK